MNRKRKWGPILLSAALLIVVVIWVLPVIFALFASFKGNLELKKFAKLRNILPLQWTTENYDFVIHYGAAPAFDLALNSLIVSISQVVLVLFIASTSAYAYERLTFPGKEKIFWTVFGLSMLPSVIALVPQYMLYQSIGWADRLICLITPYLGNVFYIFLLRNFLHTVPIALNEAARIDGANEWTIYSRIILPSIYPAMTVVGLFTFSNAWNDILWPSLAITTSKRLTITAGIRLLNDAYGTNPSYPERVLAACMLGMIPTILVFLAARKYFMRGLSLGAGIKG